MSFDLEGKKCALCGAYVFEEDDLVFCPECGAPHHRECYNSLGHCALEEHHGTNLQYDKTIKTEENHEEIKVAYHTEKKQPEENSDNIKCGMCGEEYSSQQPACPNCNTPNFNRMRGYAQYDFLGGVPADMDLGSGVTAEEAKNFVFTNTGRYIPKFAAMAAGVKSSWNWAAFLFPGAWLLSRKMYKKGILVSVLFIAFSMLGIPFSQAVYNNVDMTGAKNYTEMAALIAEKLPNIGIAVVIAAFIGLLFNLVLRIVIAAKGDFFYRKHTISSITEIKKDSEDIITDYRRLGGVSFWAMAAGFFAAEYLPTIIASFALM